MKRILLTLLLSAAPSLLAHGAPPAATPRQPEGEWLGVLDVGAAKLRLGLHVERHEDGTFSAILDSLDQGAKVPVSKVTVEANELSLGLEAIGASYQGRLTDDGQAIDGTWIQGGRSFPLRFERQAQAATLRRPQLPQPPFPYRTEEVTFTSAAGDIQLAGTLVSPAGTGPFPAVAMVTGSGVQDRDETLMGHKPFLVIADALARRGIASLRWDDRGAGKSGGNSMTSTLEDFTADARAAVAFLRARPEVAPKAIGVLGHSEGGLIAPMLAASGDAVDFLVLLAPPGEPLTSLLQRQARDLYRLQGLEPRLIDRALATQAEDFALLADASLPEERLRQQLRERWDRRREQFTQAERAKLGIDAEGSEQRLRAASSPWFRSLIRQDPGTYLKRVKVPVQALFGEKDRQVDAPVNAEAVKAALRAGKNPDVEVASLAGLNHLFQHATTGGIDEYGTLEETFAPEALQQIGDWIGARFRGGPSRR